MRGIGRVVGVVWLGLILALPPAVARGGPAQQPDLYDPTVVREYDFTFEARDWESALRAAGDTGNVPARLEVDGIVLEQVGVRYKGLSSMFIMSRKRPLNVTIDANVPGQRLLGYDVVNLNNGYSDPSFVREALMTELLRPFMPMQKTAFAKVSVNGQYLGLYLAVEQVEGTFVGEWFPGSDGILVKADPPAGPGMGATTFNSGLQWYGEDLAKYRTLYEVKTRDAEQAGLIAVRDAARILHAPVAEGGVSDADFPAAAPMVLDVDRALWYLAGQNLFVNYDSYYFGHNYFVYQAEEDGLLHMLAWDTSLSFGGLDLGTWGPGGGSGARVDPFALENAPDRPVIRRLLAVPEWRADYAAHYRVLLATAFDPDTLAARGEALQETARPGLATDPNRLFTLDLFERNLRQDVRPQANMGPGGKSPGVLKLAGERGAWLASRPELAAPDHRLVEHVREPDRPRPDQSPAVTLRFEGTDEATAVRLVYRVNAGPPASIELARAGDAWSGSLPGQSPGSEVTYYARVALPGDRSTFYPVANLTQPWRYTVLGPDLAIEPGGDLVINELMADNENTAPDEAGEYDDWLEVFNRGRSPIRLADYYLGKNAEDPWRYQLPDVTLPPGELYLIWCDKDPEQGVNHAPLKLTKAGDEIRLSSRTATVDVVAFGAQATDVSYARLPDGADRWWVCRSPSPGDPNQCTGVTAPTATAGATAVPTTPPPPTATAVPTTPPPTATSSAPTPPTATPGATGPSVTPNPPSHTIYLPAARRRS